MIARVQSERRPWRLLAYSVWSLFSTLLALLAGDGLVVAISDASYDPHENRAPEARIVIATIATVVGFATVAVVVKRLRGAGGRGGLLAGLLLTAATVLLIALLVIVGIASGPL